MKKQFLNLGKALSKAEQKLINGGAPPCGYTSEEQCYANNCPRTWCHPNTDPNCSGYYVCEEPNIDG